MGDVVDLPVITRLSIPPDRVLEAHVGEMDYVVVIGRTTSGESVVAASEGSMARASWALARAQHALMLLADQEDQEDQDEAEEPG